VPIRRRQFLVAAGASLVATRVIAQPATAQSQRRVWKIGFLFAGTIALRPQVQGFEQGLRDQGYIEGQNVTILRREAQGQLDQLPRLAVQLVSENPDVIVAVTSASVRAAVGSTQTIPVVMLNAANPVGQGWVKNLARPEGNVTGPVYDFDFDYVLKRLQFMKEVLPGATRIAALWNPGSPLHKPWKVQLEQAAPTLALQIEPVSFRDAAELKAGLEKVGASGAHALFVFPDATGFEQRKSIIDFAAARRIPASFGFPEEAEDGGLMAYGARLREEYRRAALYVGKILRGARPVDLPIERAKPELVVNLRTANALGLKVPQSLLLRADRVIE
jgi:putative tryptophan/tyrosine transport system substrate-binding protein